MKTVIILFFMSISFVSEAVVYWPSIGAPCNTSLQACVDASSSGEIIKIVTNETIEESIVTTVPLSLIADIGFKPKFGQNHGITMAYNSGLPGTVTLKGLTFNRGYIEFIHSVSEVTLNLLNNQFIDDVEEVPPVFIQSFSTSDLKVNIKYNHINSYVLSTDLAQTYGAISLLKNSNSGNINGEISGNTLTIAGASSKGIVLNTEGLGAEFDINITANEVFGGGLGGIYIGTNSTSGNNQIDIISNALVKDNDLVYGRGIVVESDSGTSSVDIINNTIMSKSIGIAVWRYGGAINSNIFNNIVSSCTFSGLSFAGTPTINNDYNLIFANESHHNFIPGANSIIGSDPKFIHSKNFRLKSDSPALDAGNPLALLFAADATEVDADGLLRVKRSTNLASATVDIGAYEAGDFSFNHISSADNTNVSSTSINSAYTNGLASLDNLHITANRGLDFAAPVNNDNEGIWYSGGFWRIFNQSLSSITDGTIFNVMSFGSNSNTFKHSVAMSGFNISQINRTGLNGNPDKILQLTQHWTSVYNSHPSGVFNDGSNWYVKNFDSENIPMNSNFNIYFQDESKSAFEHLAVAENTYTFATEIDHPILNGAGCAQIQVTQSGSQGVFNSAPIGVIYSQLNQSWNIVNQDESPIPLGAAFHILINSSQIAECSDIIFTNGFD